MGSTWKDQQQRVMIPPQLLFHTYKELSARGIDLTGDPQWRIFDGQGHLPNNQRISFMHSQNLLLRAIEISQDPDLGLAVGYRQSFAGLGLVAAAMMASETLREAVVLGMRFHSLVGTMLDFDAITLANGDMKITMKSRFEVSPVKRFLMQEAQVLILTTAHFLRPRSNPVQLVETIFRPRDTSRFERWCRCPVHFEAEEHSILLLREPLDAPNSMADSFALRETLAILIQMAAAEAHQRDLVQAVEARILRSLPIVEGINAAAGAFGLSERAFRRKLEEAGTSYREILHQVRLAIARRRLGEGWMTREQIALEIGFEDARSLRRLLEQG